MLRSWNSELFTQRQREYFLSLRERHSDGFYDEVWSDAFAEFLKTFLGSQSYEIYISNLIKTCTDLADNQLSPSYFADLLARWETHLKVKISRIARELTGKKRLEESPIRIFDSERKKSRKVIEKWVQAYQILMDLIPALERSESFNSMDGDGFSYDELFFLLGEMIEVQAEKQYGESGAIVARILLGETYSENQLAAPRKEKRLRGRPEEEFINETILTLDARAIDRVNIRILVDALQGKESSKKGMKKEDRIWRKGEQRYLTAFEYNAAKSMGKQIRRLGGNILRYQADLAVRWHNECHICIWGWNQKGEVVRVFPCPKHEDLTETVVLAATDHDWLNRITSLRGEEYFANALSWRMRDIIMKRSK